MKKIMPAMVVALAVVSGGSFYGGMKYQQAKPSTFQRGGGSGGMGMRGGGRAAFQGMNGNFGEIIAKDATSITIKSMGGGSRILFFSNATDITKSVAGTVDDLAVGKNVMARGTANTDGSVTAQSIQVVPALPQGAAVTK